MARCAVLPTPVEPTLSSPGCCRAQASRSAKERKLLSAGTTMPKVTPETWITGVMSRSGSQLTLRCSGARYSVSGSWPSVYPSGAALCKAGPTSVPAAPGRLSMVTGWPSVRLARSARMRIVMSVWPPAGQGTISVMARAG